MASSKTRSIALFLSVCSFVLAGADDEMKGARRGVVVHLLREMVNQTKADTLNLPANATSIRENITDTFSCENKTYGYYADVDNDCQVFHVCLTQASNGRNTTYRWSFICPNETVFNQEVLTCTYERDSINCEDSPMFYHLNNDIGKVNETEQTDKANTQDGARKTNKRKPPVKKQNIIVENLMKEVRKEKLVVEDLSGDLEPVVEETFVMKPQVHEVGEEYVVKGDLMENARLMSERSMKRQGRFNRGSFRYKKDV